MMTISMTDIDIDDNRMKRKTMKKPIFFMTTAV